VSAVDWADFAARNWHKSPALLAGDTPPVAAQRAWDLIVEAAAPFRSGTRFATLPDVRFFGSEGQLRAPGELLPGSGDPTFEQYSRRMAGGPYLVTIRKPLQLDFGLWSDVRDLIEPLWREVGVPTVSLVADLTLAHDLSEPRGTGGEPSHAVFTWVLDGKLQAGTLRGSAGDLLYWPAAQEPDSIRGEDCLALRLLVPTDTRLATEVVTEAVGYLLQRRRESDDVPYLPYPPPHEPVMAPMATLATELAELTTGPELERHLRIQWAKRVSAAGLEPVPDSRPSDLAPGPLVRATTRIVRMPADNGGWVWAANGHAFAVGGTAAEKVIDQLRAGPVRVGDDALLPLFRKLHTLRAIDVVPEGSD
jgi:hypothetical protein